MLEQRTGATQEQSEHARPEPSGAGESLAGTLPPALDSSATALHARRPPLLDPSSAPASRQNELSGGMRIGSKLVWMSLGVAVTAMAHTVTLSLAVLQEAKICRGRGHPSMPLSDSAQVTRDNARGSSLSTIWQPQPKTLRCVLQAALLARQQGTRVQEPGC